LFWIAGGRVRARLAAHESRTARLRALLGSPDEEIVAAVEARLDQGRLLERRARALEEELAKAVGEALGAAPDRVVDAHFEGKDAAFLQRLGRQLATSGKVALLTASLGEQGFFLLVVAEGLALDVQSVGREIAEILGGRGGGSGRVFQGKAGSLASRDAAVARLLKRAGGA
jgi:alanyl-tRNA synthetase